MNRVTSYFQTGTNLTTESTAFQVVPGLSFVVKANSQFYFDFQGWIQSSQATGCAIQFDGYDQVAGYLLPKELYDIQTQSIYYHFQGPGPSEKIWNLPNLGFNAMLGLCRVMGTLNNTQNFDQLFTVSYKALVTNPGDPAYIYASRILVTEQVQSSSNNSFTDMTHCGCCATAEISCCQTSLTINTINPSDSFDWKIVDSLGAVYTGTMETDSAGVGVITVGDGMDLPDGFLDAPGVGFKIEFLDGRPTIASKMSCLDVELVSGAYLAIQDIGEPLP